MKFYTQFPTILSFFLTAVLLCVGSTAYAQSKEVRPPVVGDREYSVLPEDTVVPQEFYIERPTLENAGFEWYVSGDANHNATVRVRFREAGTVSWRESIPMLRIQREKI